MDPPREMPKKRADDWKIDPEIQFTSGESLYDRSRADFNSLHANEKQEHVKELWRQAFLKAMGSSHLKRIFNNMHMRIINYGTTRNINRSRQDMEKKILEQKLMIVLMPEDTIKKVWNILMIFLLLYVASYVPYGICFDNRPPESPMEVMDYVDMAVDILFAIDIFINFLSSYEDPATNLPVINLRRIAGNYITGWFVLDLLAVMPVQLIEKMFETGDAQNLKLARLARLPRLYRLIRILRMIKMLRIFSKSGQFKEWMNTLNFSVGIIRMLNVLGFMFFLVHLMSCFWFMAASLEDNMYDTWVGGRGVVDSPQGYQYFNAFYWAF